MSEILTAAAIDALRIRRVLGRREWGIPEPYGPAGWLLRSTDRNGSVLVSLCPEEDGTTWLHASMSRRGGVPSYEDMVRLHAAAFGDGWAYQVFAPPEAHVNLHEHVCHIWGRLDGAAALPNFGRYGTI